MKKNIILKTVIVSFLYIICFSYLSAQEIDKNDFGYYTILVNHRFKHEFELVAESLLKEVPSIAKRNQLEDDDTEIVYEGYVIRIMSKKTSGTGRKWAQIEYTY
jgi:hypothetical protein